MRPDFHKAWEARQFFSLSLESNVHSVWLGLSGIKRLKTIRVSTGYQLN